VSFTEEQSGTISYKQSRMANCVVTVLIPKLAVMLIKEDMRANGERAQRINQESRWVREILCEDEGSVLWSLHCDKCSSRRRKMISLNATSVFRPEQPLL
jgi:hypothetical protein